MVKTFKAAKVLEVCPQGNVYNLTLQRKGNSTSILENGLKKGKNIYMRNFACSVYYKNKTSLQAKGK